MNRTIPPVTIPTAHAEQSSNPLCQRAPALTGEEFAASDGQSGCSSYSDRYKVSIAARRGEDV